LRNFLIIILITISVSLSFPAFAQEESLSEMDARLDAENLQRSQELEQKQETLEKFDCPSGYFARALSGGQIVCVNEATGQQLDDSTTGASLDVQTIFIIASVIIVIVIIAGVAAASSKKSESMPLPRRGWTGTQQKQVLEKQDGRCGECGEVSGTFHFHHRDNNRNNNDLDNCQALCPNCHDRKSRGLD